MKTIGVAIRLFMVMDVPYTLSIYDSSYRIFISNKSINKGRLYHMVMNTIYDRLVRSISRGHKGYGYVLNFDDVFSCLLRHIW